MSVDTTGIAVRLAVEGRSVTVAGSSGHAMATTGALLGRGALVTVIAPDPTPYLVDLADRGVITIHRRNIEEADFHCSTIIFACTDRFEDDEWIAQESSRHGVFCVNDATPRTRNGNHQRGHHDAADSRAGRVIIVGGGPGCPGLLTVAGREALAMADVVVTDRLAPVGLIAECAPYAQVIDASKIPGGRRMEQSRINAVLIEHALRGKTVVRLKGGDGFVFGRGGEELDECARAGISVEVIPGVSSSIAAPASALIPVTHRGLVQGFTVVSGHVPPLHPESQIDYAALAQANTTIILMMAVANLDAISYALIEGGMDPDTPAAVIADGSLPTQREVRATLSTIASAARVAEIGPPATTVIGAVAGFVPGHHTATRTRTDATVH